jgi:hypothetical protein
MRETPNSDESLGLVICDITVREIGNKCLSNSSRQLNEVKGKFPKVRQNVPNSNLPDYFIEISPASIQLSRKLPPRPGRGYTKRKAITAWSSKSRANMVKRLFTLDYSPLFADQSRTPVMITLTYPGEWESVAPNGQTAKRHISMFRKRYEREFGEPLRGIWKQEFQRRGAPHTHILTSIASDLGLFQLWVSKVWSEIVDHQDPDQRAKHLLAGTGVQAWYDFYRDKPYLIAVYFGKHASPSKGGVKDYQNKPPQLWIDAGKIGRFWGYWGLKPSKAKAQLTREDSLFIQRTLRRWYQANSKPKKFRVRRVNQKTGVITYRRITRRPKRLSNQGGFISVPNGKEMTLKLLVALNARAETVPPLPRSNKIRNSAKPIPPQNRGFNTLSRFLRLSIQNLATVIRISVRRIRKGRRKKEEPP